MDWRVFLTVFATVFVAELGDKTQLATMLFAADGETSRTTVFVAASLALVLSTALGVLAGAVLAAWVSPRLLHAIAGVAFITIGAWTLYGAWDSAASS